MTKITVQDVWAMIPRVACRGLCQASCGPISMSKAERALLPDWFPSPGEMMDGQKEDPVGYHCPLLVDGKCSEYGLRPFVCRLWGAEETLPCPHRCKVIGGPLSHAEGTSLLQVIMEVGGGEG